MLRFILICTLSVVLLSSCGFQPEEHAINFNNLAGQRFWINHDGNYLADYRFYADSLVIYDYTLSPSVQPSTAVSQDDATNIYAIYAVTHITATTTDTAFLKYDTTNIWYGGSSLGTFHTNPTTGFTDYWIWDWISTTGGIVLPKNSVTAEFKYIEKPYLQKDVTVDGTKYGVFMYDWQQMNGQAEVYSFVVEDGWMIKNLTDSTLVMIQYDTDWESEGGYNSIMENRPICTFHKNIPIEVVWGYYSEHSYP